MSCSRPAKAVGADASLEATVYKGEHETKLVLNAKNLPPPARIATDTKFFVLWGRKDSSATWQRAGDIVYDADARSGTFKGSFPEVEFDVEVSVEKDDAAASPSPDIVFSQHVGPA